MSNQVIIVGHGYKKGLVFGNRDVPADEFRGMFEAPHPAEKEVICLACKTGFHGMGSVMSESSSISHFVGPFQSVNGCVSALFATTFLHERLVAHYSAKVAFKHARKDLRGAASFRLWENGKLKIGPK